MAEFDRIAPVYDETRRPLSPEALTMLRSVLTKAAVTSILEVGVGTGRISIPLQKSGWAVTGVDVSTGMLRRARAKGLLRPIRADAERLPFANEAFDGALLAHVLHVFSDPSAALRETARVSRSCVLVFLRASSDSPADVQRRRQAWAIVRDLRTRYGLPPVARPRRWWREGALLRAVPPLELHPVPGSHPGRSAEDWISGLEKRAYPGLADVPDDVLHRLTRELRQQVHDLPAPGPRTERLAVWRADQLRNLPELVPERPLDETSAHEAFFGDDTSREHLG